MAITFLFWFESFGLFLPYGIYNANIITFSVFLILASTENERQAKDKSFLKAAGIVNIVSAALIFFFPIGFSGPGTLSPEEKVLVYGIVYIAPALITYIPRIFSFGIVFFILGFKNRDPKRKLLMYAGIMWLIYTIWASICLFSTFGLIPYLAYILSDFLGVAFEPYLLSILLNIFGVGNLFYLLGTTFLLIYGYSENDLKLKIAGFVYLFGTIALSLSIIPYYFEMMFM